MHTRAPRSKKRPSALPSLDAKKSASGRKLGKAQGRAGVRERWVLAYPEVEGR